ncbi:MAG: hypothetical protein P1V51_17645 [Deltaproteobacteria bacterium]|nr:hypothetical protein [Deltaproteobacteria bacterium]
MRRLLSLLALVLFTTLAGACWPVEDDDGSGGDGGTIRDAGWDAGGFDGGGSDAGGEDGGGLDGGGSDGGGIDDGGVTGPCADWPSTAYATPGCGAAPLSVYFDSTELQQAYTANGCNYWGVTWDFGDGDTSTGDYPIHVFTPGDYLVRADGDGECCDTNGCYTFGLNLTDIPIRAY